MGYATKEEQKTWRLRTYATRRAAWFEGKSCAQCGSTEQLELDHVDQDSKERRNDHNVWLWGQGRREAELAKCRPLCRPCHLKRHADIRRTAKHGTASMYANGCRCDDCRIAKVAANRDYLKRKREATASRLT